MEIPDDWIDDVFVPAGRLRTELFSDGAVAALQEAIRVAEELHRLERDARERA